MIEEGLKELKPLESFSKDVFVGNDEYSQELCNFILTLALIWNDLKNIMLLLEYIKSLQPKDVIFDRHEEMPKTPFWGEISGIKIHLEKLYIALLHELFSLIRKSNEIIESKCFKNLFRQLRKNSRISWQILMEYAHGKANTETPLGKALLMVRHKIANHYDKDEIFKGYQRKFNNYRNKPYISRGNNMLEQRFYFADAAAQEFYINYQEKVTTEEFYKNINLIKDSINFSLKNIVESFIQKRSPWKEIK